jgi:hypothetical protein
MSKHGRRRRGRRGRSPAPWQLLPLAFVLCVVLASLVAYTATNTFASGGRASVVSQAISIDDITPASCKSHGIHPTAVLYHNGVTWVLARGNGKSELMLGSQYADVIHGGPASDCLVPGGVPLGGIDAMNGGAGGDDCLGGPGPGTYTRTKCDWADSYPYTS